jgi:BMFP domain-containing protein YqiC
MTREAQAGLQERVKDWVGGMDFVSRDEFEAVKAMAIAARDENDALRARIAALEAAAGPAAASGATFAEGAPPEAA